MRRHALLGVFAAISCARQATAWDDKCWDFNSFRASLWLPFSKGDTRSRQLTRTVNGTGHTGPSEFCATSI